MGRQRQDRRKGREKREEGDAEALELYKSTLLLMSDAKLAMKESVREIREKSLKAVTIPELDEDAVQEADRQDRERCARLMEIRKRELRALREEQQASRKKEPTPTERFFDLLEQCEDYVSRGVADATDTHKKRGGKRSASKATGGKLSASKEERRTSEQEGDKEVMDVALADESNATPGVLTSHPPYLYGQLRPYQIEGVNWLLRLHSRCLAGILADEMGLGKTFQTISLLSYLKFSLAIPGPHLVVCPKSVLHNWNREFARWSPGLSSYVFHGMKEERPALIRYITSADFNHDVVLTTWEMILSCGSTFRNIHWRYLIIDEGHRLKNEESQISVAVRRIRCTNRLLITGTPLQNNLKELWALLNFLIPTLFTDSDDFESWFDLLTGVSDETVVNNLHKILKPFMLRRVKSEADTTIPPKKEVYVSCDLSEKQREWYCRVLAKDHEVVDGDVRNPNQARVRLMNILMQLRKVCNHPYLFDGAEEGPPFVTNEKIVEHCGKMVVLDKILKRLLSEPKEKRQKVLIFTQMTRMLDIIEDYLTLRKWDYYRLDGNTSGEDRDYQMTEFNKPDSKVDIFILSTRAGGLGVNLQTASFVILYDSDWNPQMDLQAQDRAHRIGQTRTVTVCRFITDGTVEEKVYQRALRKLYLDAVVVQQGHMQQKNQSLSPDEIKGMIRWGAEVILKRGTGGVRDVDIDKILEVGSKQMNDLHSRMQESQQKSLKNFSLGIDDTNLYEFEGVNYGDQPTRSLFIEGLNDTIDHRHLEDAFSPFGDLRKCLVSPARDKGMVVFRDLQSAAKAQNKLHGKKIEGVGPISIHYGSRGSLFTESALQEVKQVEETTERTKRAAAMRAFEQKEESAQKGPKLPRAPRLADHQFFNKDRLEELHEKECAWIMENHKSGKDRTEALTPQEHAERKKLLEEGFASWTSSDFAKFISASARHGRSNIKAIAEELEKEEDDVRRYQQAFWTKGPTSLIKFEHYRKRIEKGEGKHKKRLDDCEMLRWKLIEGRTPPFNPWSPTWPLPKSTDLPQNINDRYLFCFAAQEGCQWDRVKYALQNAPEFRFDLFQQSRTSGDLHHRFNVITKNCRKEYEDKKRSKQQQVEAVAAHSTGSSLPRSQREQGSSKAKKRSRPDEPQQTTKRAK